MPVIWSYFTLPLGLFLFRITNVSARPERAASIGTMMPSVVVNSEELRPPARKKPKTRSGTLICVKSNTRAIEFCRRRSIIEDASPGFHGFWKGGRVRTARAQRDAGPPCLPHRLKGDGCLI